MHIFVEISPASRKLVKLGVKFVLLPEEPFGSANYVSDEQWRDMGLVKVSRRPSNGYLIWRIGNAAGEQTKSNH